MKFTALLHHLTVELLRESFYSLKRKAASGVDGVTWQEPTGRGSKVVTMITAPLAADFVTFCVRSPITWSCTQVSGKGQQESRESGPEGAQ
jgi:hypothetical protein